MRTMAKSFSWIILVGGLWLLPGLAGAQEETPEPPAKPVGVYRLDFALHEIQNGERVNTRNYVMRLAHEGVGQIRTSSKVPVAVGSGEQLDFVDVGLDLDCTLQARGELLWLRIVLELSDFRDSEKTGIESYPVRRNLRSRVDTAVPLGKAIVASVVDDAVASRWYELEVKATKVE